MQVLALTSRKGGVGKSTLALNLAGALAMRASTTLIDEDQEVGTSGDWYARGTFPFALGRPGQRPAAGTAYLVIDTEGRPDMADMVALTRQAGRVLIPSGANGLELASTVKHWRRLEAEGGQMAAVRVVITKAPPTGGTGAAARDRLRELGLTVCSTVVRSYAAHQRANEQAVLVRDVAGDPRAEIAWGDIVSLALEVC